MNCLLSSLHYFFLMSPSEAEDGTPCVLILEISLHFLWMLHFLEVVVVRTEGSVTSQISEFRFTFHFYVYC